MPVSGKESDRSARTAVVMNVARSLWASVQGDPVFMRRVNGWLTMFWVAMIPIAYAAGWLTSVTFVSALSLWALVSGHWSAWQAARVEVTQKEEEEAEAEDPVEHRVVEKIIERTDVDAAPQKTETIIERSEEDAAPPEDDRGGRLST
jgi:hypothetical protein